MFRTTQVLVCAGTLLLAGTRVFGSETFVADLTHAQETTQGALTTSTGDPRPESFGTATFTLNDSETALLMFVTIFNIDVTGTQTPDTFDNLLAAHIHAAAPMGQNAGVRWGFFGSPDNDTNPDNLVVTPFATGVGGTFSSVWDLPEGNGGTTLAAQLPNLRGNLAYLNFHTVQFGGGEIRGQIIHVPDGGATAALLGFAFLGITGARRLKLLS
jgi:hypothetical protein